MTDQYVTPPFARFLGIEMDVCLVGVEAAFAEWFKHRNSYATVLWVHPNDLASAEKVILLSPEGSLVRRLTPIPDPHYSDMDWWSVGTHLDRGFGSIGA